MIDTWNNDSTIRNNSILRSLLSINSNKSYWLAPYDPDKLYTEIGNYSVFVMNNTRLTSSQYGAVGAPMMNTLFIAKMGEPPPPPPPPGPPPPP